MTGLQDGAGWGIVDPRPGVPLDDIEPRYVRVLALLARRIDRPILKDNFLTVAGAASFLDGLEYHFARYVEIVTRAAAGDESRSESVVHEVVAYMNRLGQFHYFATSDLLKPLVSGVATPTIDELLDFRMKFSAHRSLDKPRRESSATREAQALSLGGFGSMWQPKVPKLHWPPPTGSERWRTHHRVFQMKTSETGDFVNFVMETHHPLVAAEAYDVFAALLA